MIMYVLVLLSSFVANSWADDYQSILTQITENKECNSQNLLGGFDLKSVPQFDALCNIPIPDIQQSEFLLENNVVPILCMGLMDVSLRLCNSAKDDVSPFEELFPPSAKKFSQLFARLSESKNFSSPDEFCSTTVNQFSIKENASNTTKSWWKVLNNQLSDENRCLRICHSNEGKKVHPLCSYILWSNGVFINFKKNKVDQASLGERYPPGDQKVEEPADQGDKINQGIDFVKDGFLTKPTEAVVGPDVSQMDKKIQIENTNKSNLSTDRNNVGVGTVEQIVQNVEQSSIIGIVKTDANSSADLEKPAKNVNLLKGNKNKVKVTATTSNPIKSSDAANNVIQGQLAPSTSPKASSVPSNLPIPQDNSGDLAPELKKQAQSKPSPEGGKATDDMVEGDVSIEVTPDGVGLDHPITADKEFQPPPFSEEEGEEGDGDDVEIEESNGQANTNSANNNSKPASNTGNIQQGALEGDKVYGDGEILIEDHFIEAEDSHFFTYFLCMAVLTIMAYLAFHNKKKLIALAVEGRRTKGGRRRPNSSHYSKLDCSLEEALVSNTTASVTHVLY